MRQVTRRSFLLASLIAPMACLGCSGNAVAIDTKAGEKRRRKMEDLQMKANQQRNSRKEKAR
jgi:hypothetical protein